MLDITRRLPGTEHNGEAFTSRRSDRVFDPLPWQTAINKLIIKKGNLYNLFATIHADSKNIYQDENNARSTKHKISNQDENLNFAKNGRQGL